MIACLAPQVDAFCWLVVAGKVSEVDNGRRYMVSVEILDICFMCGKQRKPINHFLFIAISHLVFGVISPKGLV